MGKWGVGSNVTRYALKARWVVPVDRPAIDGGIVSLSGDRIVAVGRRAVDGAPIRDLGETILLPGFVNAHTHLEFSDLAGPLGQPRNPFVDWIRLVIAARARRDRSSLDAIAAGLAESLRRGVTTLGEITSSVPAADAADRPAPARRLFLEVFGFSRARTDSAARDAQWRLANAERTTSVARPGDYRPIQLGVSPHAPYTVNLELLDRLVELARRHRLPVAMHIAEFSDEARFLAEGTGPMQELLAERSMWDAAALPPGTRPLDYLARLAAAPRVLVVHGNFLADDELTLLAEHAGQMTLIHCPRTHAFFDHTALPLERAIAIGVKVALGTDSRASNPDLCLLSEMRAVFGRCPMIAPGEILRMGTQIAADALGVGGTVGTLTPGKMANLVAVSIPQNAAAVDDPLEALLAGKTPPETVWLRGIEVDPAPPT